MIRILASIYVLGLMFLPVAILLALDEVPGTVTRNVVIVLLWPIFLIRIGVPYVWKLIKNPSDF